MAVSDRRIRDFKKTMALDHSEASALTSYSRGAAIKERVKDVLRERRKTKTRDVIKSLHSRIINRLRGTASQ